MPLSKALLAVLSLPLLAAFSPHALAAESGDLHIGGFKGTGCGYYANFSIERQDKGTWVFHGHVMFTAPEYASLIDTFDVEQRANNSLIMVRHLSQAPGTYQRVWTNVPPDGVHFTGIRAEGPDCVGKRTEMRLK